MVDSMRVRFSRASSAGSPMSRAASAWRNMAMGLAGAGRNWGAVPMNFLKRIWA
jgi:hypothetical protein